MPDGRVNARSRPSPGPPPASREETPASCPAAACRGLPRSHHSKWLLSPASTWPRAVMATPRACLAIQQRASRPRNMGNARSAFQRLPGRPGHPPAPSGPSLPSKPRQRPVASLAPLRAGSRQGLRSPSDPVPAMAGLRQQALRPLLTQPTTASHLHLMQIRQILTSINIDKRFL